MCCCKISFHWDPKFIRFAYTLNRLRNKFYICVQRPWLNDYIYEHKLYMNEVHILLDLCFCLNKTKRTSHFLCRRIRWCPIRINFIFCMHFIEDKNIYTLCTRMYRNFTKKIDIQIFVLDYSYEKINTRTFLIKMFIEPLYFLFL